MCAASVAFRASGRAGVELVWDCMMERERIAFDLWLVKLRDALMSEGGPAFDRFLARSVAMATNRHALDVLRDIRDGRI